MLKNVLEVRKNELYDISYSIPMDNKEEFDLYIEQGVGSDGIAVLEDVTEQESNGRISGIVTLSFDNEHVFNADYLFEVANCLEEMSAGRKFEV